MTKRILHQLPTYVEGRYVDIKLFRIIVLTFVNCDIYDWPKWWWTRES